MLCTFCGADVDEGKRFCSACGNAVIAAPALPTSEVMGCRVCGAETAPGEEFCRACEAAFESLCPECSAPVTRDAQFCGECGEPLDPDQGFAQCSVCGRRPAETDTFCQGCGAPLGASAEGISYRVNGSTQSAPSAGRPQGVMSTAYAAAPQSGAAPGIGIAGFVLSLLGFSILGLILSWVGYASAKREGRPTGLCLAGIIIGALGLIATVIVVIVIVRAGASTGSTY